MRALPTGARVITFVQEARHNHYSLPIIIVDWTCVNGNYNEAANANLCFIFSIILIYLILKLLIGDILFIIAYHNVWYSFMSK